MSGITGAGRSATTRLPRWPPHRSIRSLCWSRSRRPCRSHPGCAPARTRWPAPRPRPARNDPSAWPPCSRRIASTTWSPGWRITAIRPSGYPRGSCACWSHRWGPGSPSRRCGGWKRHSTRQARTRRSRSRCGWPPGRSAAVLNRWSRRPSAATRSRLAGSSSTISTASAPSRPITCSTTHANWCRYGRACRCWRPPVPGCRSTIRNCFELIRGPPSGAPTFSAYSWVSAFRGDSGRRRRWNCWRARCPSLLSPPGSTRAATRGCPGSSCWPTSPRPSSGRGTRRRPPTRPGTILPASPPAFWRARARYAPRRSAPSHASGNLPPRTSWSMTAAS